MDEHLTRWATRDAQTGRLLARVDPRVGWERLLGPILGDVTLGSDFSFGVRSGALEAAAAVAKADAGEHHHFPYARRLRLGWRHDADGRWTSEGEDERRWEVFCAECGDTDGPAENQAEPARHLRGPYPSEHKATHAAKKHFDDN